MLNKRCIKSVKRDIFCFDFRSNFLVSISFLINIGKELSLPYFRGSVNHDLAAFPFQYSCFNFFSAIYWKGKIRSRLNVILLF